MTPSEEVRREESIHSDGVSHDAAVATVVETLRERHDISQIVRAEARLAGGEWKVSVVGAVRTGET